jgi:hypothetical protein
LDETSNFEQKRVLLWLNPFNRQFRFEGLSKLNLCSAGERIKSDLDNPSATDRVLLKNETEIQDQAVPTGG